MKPVFIAALIAVPALTGAALAEKPPGKASYACRITAACNAGGCIALPGEIAGLRLLSGPTDQKKVIESAGRPFRTGVIYPDADSALEAARYGMFPVSEAVVLIPAPGETEAIGLRAHVALVIGGAAALSDDYAQLACAKE